MQNLDEKILEMLKDKKNSVLQIAMELGVHEYEVLKFKDSSVFKAISGENLSQVLDEISNWGEIMFCKNTPEFIIEFKTRINAPKLSRGYYNFSAQSGFLGGHLKQDCVKQIGFVSTEFMGVLGHSVHFYNDKNETIFKFYLNRDEKRELNPNQVEKFLALKNKF